MLPWKLTEISSITKISNWNKTRTEINSKNKHLKIFLKGQKRQNITSEKNKNKLELKWKQNQKYKKAISKY